MTELSRLKGFNAEIKCDADGKLVVIDWSKFCARFLSCGRVSVLLWKVKYKVNGVQQLANMFLPLWELTCHTGSHSVTCHRQRVTFPLLPQPIMAGTRFSDPGWMQGWVDLVGLVTHRGGIPAWRWSPIPVLTVLNVEQLRLCDERRYHNAKPPRCNTLCTSGFVDGVWFPYYVSRCRRSETRMEK